MAEICIKCTHLSVPREEFPCNNCAGTNKNRKELELLFEERVDKVDTYTITDGHSNIQIKE
ncbi:MAG: hypothetical protein QXG00_07885 [Candidatus Woesearchaeota archaeon]